MGLSDYRWYVSACGQPVAISWPDGPWGTFYGLPTRDGWIFPRYVVSASELSRRLCFEHKKEHHPDSLYLD